MTEFLRIDNNLIALLILIILIINMKTEVTALLDEKLFRQILVMSLFMIIFDTLTWIWNGADFPGARGLILFVNASFFILSVYVPMLWLMYVQFRISEDEDRIRQKKWWYLTPFLLYTGMVIITVFTGWIFYLDDQNVYGRGPLYFVQIACSFGYLLFSTMLALRKAFSVQSAAERKEFYSLSSFVAFPIAAAVSQIIFYGLSEISIMIVVSELLIFINVQNKQISMDALTRINNRGQFNRYLGVRTKDMHGEDKLYMILIDIDKFKTINDTYGHDMGDRALIDTADILKNVCGKYNGFLARYGGD